VFQGLERLHARACLVGERIDMRALEQAEVLAHGPLTVRAGDRGCAMLFRFGSVVFFELTPIEEVTFLEGLKPFVKGPFEEPDREDLAIVVESDQNERIDAAGTLHLREASIERLQVAAHVLAKSTVLAHYEARVAKVFDRIEPLAEGMQRGKRRGAPTRVLLEQIGDVLLAQTRTVGRAEVTEKPEITWDKSELDRLYERLAFEFELRDRDLALSRKLDLITRTAQTFLNLLQHRRTLHVEWYIVILILVEIVLSLYAMITGH
jgi:uncharacterized Rmd1/YagE family protein